MRWLAGGVEVAAKEYFCPAEAAGAASLDGGEGGSGEDALVGGRWGTESFRQHWRARCHYLASRGSGGRRTARAATLALANPLKPPQDKLKREVGFLTRISHPYVARFYGVVLDCPKPMVG
jgi:hypothetical protein